MSYTGGLSETEQRTRLQAFIEGRTSILVCTASLQAGIDVDVRTVISLGSRDCVEEVVQEAGRAGRRQQSGYHILLYKDKRKSELSHLESAWLSGQTCISELILGYFGATGNIGKCEQCCVCKPAEAATVLSFPRKGGNELGPPHVGFDPRLARKGFLEDFAESDLPAIREALQNFRRKHARFEVGWTQEDILCDTAIE